jgi:MFS family permease
MDAQPSLVTTETSGFTSPQSPRGLKPSLAVLALVMFASYAGLGQVLLPNQLDALDAAHKVQDLTLISSVSFVFTLLTQPIIGTFSDRTRSRLGRRGPWIMIGGAIGGLLLVGIGSLGSVLWVAVFWIVLQVSLNAVQGPFTAIIPDRYPRQRRGIASAMFGIGTSIGLTLGVVVAGQLALRLGVAYATFGGLILVATLAFVLLNRDFSSRGVPTERLTLRTLVGGLWVSPRKNPDFAWAFTARFFFILGYFMVLFFELYLLTDYVHLSLPQANSTIGLLALVNLATTLPAVLIGGFVSDRIGRRKRFIYLASSLVALGFLVPIFVPTNMGMAVMSAISGIGFGLYTACDTALMTEVLPREGASAGKDLGILNIATNLPQALSTVAGGVLISVIGYRALFGVGIVFVVLAAFALRPIKSVR